MDLHNIYHHNRGLTLIEVMIAIGIMALILALGLFLSMDFFKSSSFAAEQKIIVSVLQKARNQSMNNINQTRHGVHFEKIGQEYHYILFECPDDDIKYLCNRYDTDSKIIFTIKSSYNNFTMAVPFDIIFEQLTGNNLDGSGNPTSTIVEISEKGLPHNIDINEEGRINW